MPNSYKNSYITTQKNLVSLAVYSAGYEKCLANHYWGPGIRDHYLLHHVISGKGYYKLNNTLYELNQGDTFLIYPFEEVLYYPNKDDPWEYAWVGFSGADAKMILNTAGFSHLSPVLYQNHTSDHIKTQLLHIYEARGSELSSAVEMTGHLYIALSSLIQTYQNENTSHAIRNSSYEGYTQKAVSYIHSNYAYPITVENIAHYVGLSRSHLYRVFEETFAQSPKDYLTTFRMKQACILLLHSDLSITAIGRSVGYEDNLNFSKAFKKAIGCSPSNYGK